MYHDILSEDLPPSSKVLKMKHGWVYQHDNDTKQVDLHGEKGQSTNNTVLLQKMFYLGHCQDRYWDELLLYMKYLFSTKFWNKLFKNQII